MPSLRIQYYCARSANQKLPCIPKNNEYLNRCKRGSDSCCILLGAMNRSFSECFTVFIVDRVDRLLCVYRYDALSSFLRRLGRTGEPHIYFLAGLGMASVVGMFNCGAVEDVGHVL